MLPRRSSQRGLLSESDQAQQRKLQLAPAPPARSLTLLSHSFHNLASCATTPATAPSRGWRRTWRTTPLATTARGGAPTTHHSSQHHLPWGGATTPWTTPRRPRDPPPPLLKQRLHQSCATPNPHTPLPAAPPAPHRLPGPLARPRYALLERHSRRVLSPGPAAELGFECTLWAAWAPPGQGQGHHYQNLQSGQSHGTAVLQGEGSGQDPLLTDPTQTHAGPTSRLLVVVPGPLEEPAATNHAVSGGDERRGGRRGGRATMGRLSHQKAPVPAEHLRHAHRTDPTTCDPWSLNPENEMRRERHMLLDHCGPGGGAKPASGGGANQPLEAEANQPSGGGVKPASGGGVKPASGGGVKPASGGGVKPASWRRKSNQPLEAESNQPLEAESNQPLEAESNQPLEAGVKPASGGGVKPASGGGVKPASGAESNQPLEAESNQPLERSQTSLWRRRSNQPLIGVG
ncbi:unnamed protein product [Arctogadus glacialis]